MDWRIPLPKIRNVNPTAAIHNRQPVYYLQDPLQLADSTVIIPQQLGAILMLCDGTRTLQTIRSSLISIFGIRTSDQDLKELFLALDRAYLLENKRFEEAHANALSAYREAPARVPIHAGVSYPSDPEQLRKMLDGFSASAELPEIDGTIRGIISPHIDFARGGTTYAAAWKVLESKIDELELVILFGTDHHGNGEPYTLTRQDYATPFGTLPTFQPGVDLLVDIYGDAAVFAGEIRHRSEHSLEFAAVWLHYFLDGRSCPVLPILCDDLPVGDQDGTLQPAEDSRMQAAISSLVELIHAKQTLVVAAGDLSHIGPAFGGSSIHQNELEDLSELDHALLKPVEAGDAAEFHRMILSEKNATNVCGTAPIVNTLELLAPVRGDLIDYQQCAADQDETSWVSICALHLY